MEKYFEVLSKCPLFRDIEEKNLAALLRCLGARVEVFGEKYTIMAEGSSSRYIGIMLSGSAQIVSNDYFGNRSIVATVNEGDVFAEAFACAGVTAIPVSVVADGEAIVMLVDCNHIVNTCTNACGFHQQLIYNLMKELATKNIIFHQKLEVTSKRTTREKLLTYLAQVAARVGKSSFDLPFDRQELADYLEVERSGLSVEIGKLRREGIIENKKNHFKLLKL